MHKVAKSCATLQRCTVSPFPVTCEASLTCKHKVSHGRSPAQWAASSLCSLFCRQQERRMKKPGSCSWTTIAKGHSSTISFPKQSHNPMLRTDVLITHLGKCIHPFSFHWLRINLPSVLHENNEVRNLSGGRMSSYYKVEHFYSAPVWLIVFPPPVRGILSNQQNADPLKEKVK